MFRLPPLPFPRARSSADMLMEMIEDEKEAVSRYQQYAKIAEEQEDRLTAALFNLLAFDEARHRDSLVDRLRKVGR